MRLLFIYPDIFDYALSKGIFYTGIASIAAVVKKDTEWDVALMHMTRKPDPENFLQEIQGHHPDLIAFSATTNMYPYVATWSAWIKARYPDIKILCGGVHAIIASDEVAANPDIDIVCIGEGEYAVAELCQRLGRGVAIKNVHGLWVKDAGRVYKNPSRPLIQDLDALPFPDRDIFDYEHLHYESQGRATVMCSRGCPYGCTYCCNETLRKVFGVKNREYVRFRSVANCIAELRQIKKRYPFINSFSFEDDILPLRKDWFREFTNRYQKEINMPYDCNLRPNLVDEEMVDLLKQSGCTQIRIGVESGNDYIRNKVLRRGLTREQIAKACMLCHKAGISVFSFNIVGLPHETLEMMLDTVALNAELDTEVNQATIFYPYQRTPLFDLCQKESLISQSKEVRDYSQDTILRVSWLHRNRIIFIQKFFRVLVKIYKGLNRLPEKIKPVMKTLFKSLAFNPVSSLTLLPMCTGSANFIMKNKYLASGARALYRKFLKGS